MDRRVTISWGCAMQRKMTGQHRNSSRLLIPRRISSFVFTPDDRPDAVVRCSPPGSGYSPKLNGLPCMLRGLQPSEDRVAIGEWGKKLDRLREVVTTMGHILAWDQLRASGRSGSARADELIAFAQRGDWATEMLDAATEMTKITQQQWKIFKEALSSRQSAEPTP